MNIDNLIEDFKNMREDGNSCMRTVIRLTKQFKAEQIHSQNVQLLLYEDGQLIALPIGEYVLEDGMLLVVSEELNYVLKQHESK